MECEKCGKDVKEYPMTDLMGDVFLCEECKKEFKQSKVTREIE